MTRRKISNLLIVLLLLFLCGTALMGVSLIPNLAHDIVSEDPSLLPYQAPMILYLRVLLVFLAIGISCVISLIQSFKKDHTYTKSFIRRLDFLCVLTLIANFILIACLNYTKNFGGLGPLSIFVILLIIFIFIVALVIVLVRTVVKEAMVYKEENDLVV